MAYESTTVPVERSQGAIRELLVRHGAQQFSFSEGGNPETGDRYAAVDFIHRGHLIRFRATLRRPDPKEVREKAQRARTRTRTQIEIDAYVQEERRVWRVLFHSLKARMVAVEEGLETFEQAFLAHLVNPATGATLWDHVHDAVDAGHLQIGGRGLPALEAGDDR